MPSPCYAHACMQEDALLESVMLAEDCRSHMTGIGNSLAMTSLRALLPFLVVDKAALGLC